MLAAPKARAEKKKSPSKTVTPPGPGSWLLPPPADGGRLLYVAFRATEQQPGNTTAGGMDDGRPRLMLRISGEDDAGGIRADGISAARVQVFYMADAAPVSDVKIWLQWWISGVCRRREG